MPSGVEGFQPRRLTMAREASALKKRELADLVDRSEATISKWESFDYNQSPEPSIIARLSQILFVEPNWFFKPAGRGENAVFYRSLVSELFTSRAKTRSKLYFLEAIEQCLIEYVELPDIDLPDIMAGRSFLDLRQEDIEEISAEVRSHFEMGDGPIDNLMQIVENSGTIVAEGYTESLKLDGVSAWSSNTKKPYMFLATDKNSGTRRRLDTAHEFGHIILHKNVTPEQLEKHFALIEDQAMSFASSFLMPADEFLSDIYSTSLDALLDCKQKWGVSVGAMIKRLSRCGEITDQYERRLWQYYSHRRWRTKEPGDEIIQIEKPLNIKESLEMIVTEGEATGHQLAKEIGLSAQYISSICGLSEDFFAPTNTVALRRTPVMRKNTESGDQFTDNIIDFSAKRGTNS